MCPVRYECVINSLLSKTFNELKYSTPSHPYMFTLRTYNAAISKDKVCIYNYIL